MAITATLYRFQLELADIDRGVYETLDLRVAQHPSEDDERMVVRVLARAIAHEEGLAFGRGLSNVDDAALWTRDDTGEVSYWIDVGIPSAERLHRAAKRARRVAVFTHKPETSLRKEWMSRTVHRAESIEVVRLSADSIRTLAENLDRSVHWYVTLQDDVVSVAEGERSVDGTITRTSLAEFLSQP